MPMPVHAGEKKVTREYCQCAKASLNSWPVGEADLYCPGCGQVLIELNRIPSLDPKLVSPAFFSIEESDKGILHSNLFLQKKTLNPKGLGAPKFNLILLQFDWELRIKKDNRLFKLVPFVEETKKGLSFRIKDGELRIDPNQPLAEVRLSLSHTKNPNTAISQANNEGYLGLNPVGAPFEIQIPVLGNPGANGKGTYHWQTTQSIPDTLKIAFTSKYSFCLARVGYFPKEWKTTNGWFKGCYGKNQKEILEVTGITSQANKAHFQLTFYMGGTDPGKSHFIYDCVIEKTTRDLIQIVVENPNAEVKIHSNSETIFLANIQVSDRQNPGLKVTSIHIGDFHKCVRVDTAMPIPLKGDKTPVRFAINTSLFDRNQDHGKFYKIPLEIRDNLDRQWDLEMDVRVGRLDAQCQVVALDWGTTFSCLAVFDPLGGKPTHMTDRTISDNGNLFTGKPSSEGNPAISSMFAVEKIDAVTKRFELIVGNDSRLQMYAQNHPHCLVTSLKRQFYLHTEIKIYDKDYKCLEISTQDLVVEYLKQLIFAVEKGEKKEFTKIGFSYPTKTKYKDYERFCQTLVMLEKSLNRARPGLSIGLLPSINNPRGNPFHTPDEARSIAIEYLQSPTGGGKDPARVLVIYDFGGGTIDSAVLRVHNEGQSQKIELLGSSGNTHFGGDNVTWAIIQLIIKKITLADRSIRIPLYNDAETNETGDTPEGRHNKNNLAGIAENLKKNFKGYPEKKEFPFTSHLKKIKSVEGKAVYDILCGTDKNIPEKLAGLLQFSIREVYDWKIKLGGGGNPTIRELIERSVDNLKKICDKSNVQPSKIILAGQGSNLPLVLETFNSVFDPALIDFDKDRAKTRLAVGLSHFLNTVHGESSASPNSAFFPFPMSTHFSLGISRRISGSPLAREEFIQVIPIGSVLNGSKDQDVIRCDLELGGKSTLELARLFPEKPGEKIGKFDLSRPITANKDFPITFFPPGAQSRKVPPNWAGPAQALFFFEKFKDLYLVLKTQSESWGPFSFELSTPYASCLQDEVQGN